MPLSTPIGRLISVARQLAWGVRHPYMARRRAQARRQREVSAARQLAQETRQREFYRALVKPGQLVFDIGANVGNRTALFVSLGAKVIAVEPQQSCVQALRVRFTDDDVVIVAQGVAEAPGIRTMALANAQTVSSMEPAWVTSMTASQRFGAMEWPETVAVEVTTLDVLIERHGVPTFTKIDVEGFENSVLRGLSQPLPVLSFEFVKERPEATARCVRRLRDLGMTTFNYSMGETMALASDAWMEFQTVIDRVTALGEGDAWGDIYARSAPNASSHGRPA